MGIMRNTQKCCLVAWLLGWLVGWLVGAHGTILKFWLFVGVNVSLAQAIVHLKVCEGIISVIVYL
jgi:hypothetical protein